MVNFVLSGKIVMSATLANFLYLCFIIYFFTGLFSLLDKLGILIPLVQKKVLIVIYNYA